MYEKQDTAIRMICTTRQESQKDCVYTLFLCLRRKKSNHNDLKKPFHPYACLNDKHHHRQHFSNTRLVCFIERRSKGLNTYIIHFPRRVSQKMLRSYILDHIVKLMSLVGRYDRQSYRKLEEKKGVLRLHKRQHCLKRRNHDADLIIHIPFESVQSYHALVCASMRRRIKPISAEVLIADLAIVSERDPWYEGRLASIILIASNKQNWHQLFFFYPPVF